MNVTLSSELERFIEEQVKAGRFSSTREALEAGVARLMLDGPDTLDGRDVVEIRASLEQMRRGETIDWKQRSAELRKKYLAE